MTNSELVSTEKILIHSFLLFKKNNKAIQLGNDVIPINESELKSSNNERFDMKHFLLNKHNAVEENVFYSSKILYELLEKEKHIDQLFEEFAAKQHIKINLNLERILYLSLTFLFSLGKVNFNQNMLRRIEE